MKVAAKKGGVMISLHLAPVAHRVTFLFMLSLLNHVL